MKPLYQPRDGGVSSSKFLSRTLAFLFPATILKDGGGRRGGRVRQRWSRRNLLTRLTHRRDRAQCRSRVVGDFIRIGMTSEAICFEILQGGLKNKAAVAQPPSRDPGIQESVDEGLLPNVEEDS